MLEILGRQIKRRPWLIVSLILAVTLVFSSVLPSLEMQTSMEDFLPDDAVVQAQDRINEYFGSTDETLMVLVETKDSESIVKSAALQNINEISKTL